MAQTPRVCHTVSPHGGSGLSNRLEIREQDSVLGFLREVPAQVLYPKYLLQRPCKCGAVSARQIRAAGLQDILNATVYGTLGIAALQGVLAGVAFWFLGVTSAGLRGIVTAVCALLPFIGTGIVLLPAISMLMFSGHWIKGLILLAWRLIIVHPVDNLLRPHLIGSRTKLSTLYVFFALLGGLQAFGGLGIFIGPIVLAITLAFLKFLREEKRADTMVDALAES